MKRIEKALNERLKDVRQEIISIYCPHEFGMKDTCFEGCDMSCEECWNMEIEENTDGDCIQKNA
jgi:hypothetical protein